MTININIAIESVLSDTWEAQSGSEPLNPEEFQCPVTGQDLDAAFDSITAKADEIARIHAIPAFARLVIE